MITIISHGHKFGNPEANFKFDVSYFKNPWREDGIREEKNIEKRKEMITKFMKSQEGLEVFVDRVVSLFRLIHLLNKDENIVVAFCCSAGEYRSPVIAEMVGEKLGANISKVCQGVNSKL